MNAKTRSAVVIIAVLVLGLIAVKIYRNNAAGPVDSNAMRSKGDPQAKVQIIEFIDLQCPACAKGSKTLKEYMEKHPQDIHLQLKYFPLKSHSHGMQSALYSECAGRQNLFWPFHELLIERQEQWSPLPSAEPMFVEMAKAAGVDTGKLNSCIGSPEAAKAVNDDRSLGQSLGIQSTPTYFINNKMAVGIKSLKDELDTFFPPDK
jgi:protein-disulfide isomerase